MLLQNVAPSVGLFNGAQVEFVGPLYLDDELQVTISRRKSTRRRCDTFRPSRHYLT